MMRGMKSASAGDRGWSLYQRLKMLMIDCKSILSYFLGFTLACSRSAIQKHVSYCSHLPAAFFGFLFQWYTRCSMA